MEEIDDGRSIFNRGDVIVAGAVAKDVIASGIQQSPDTEPRERSGIGVRHFQMIFAYCKTRGNTKMNVQSMAITPSRNILRIATGSIA